jgi:hypothetical protein
MYQDKCATEQVRDSWGGDFVSSERIAKYESMVKDSGEAWTPLYLSLIDKYQIATCPYCKAYGAFKYYLFGKMKCPQCKGEFKITIGDYLHRNLVKKMINKIIDAFGDGVIGVVIVFIFTIPFNVILTFIGIPMLLFSSNKPPTQNTDQKTKIDEKGATELFWDINCDNNYNDAEEMVADFIKNINRDFLNKKFIREWTDIYLKKGERLGEQLYIDAENKSEEVLNKYLEMLDNNASYEERAKFFKNNDIEFDSRFKEISDEFAVELYTAIK